MRTSSDTKTPVARIAMILAVAVVIGATGCAGRQPLVERDDVAITTDVRARIAADTQLNQSGITVDTKLGIVRLGGSVTNDGVRNAAEQIARDTPGVRSVDNNVIFGTAETPAASIVR